MPVFAWHYLSIIWILAGVQDTHTRAPVWYHSEQHSR